ncbi:MAG: glycosyltransferase family 9 protein [Planctomycetota bacterium]
MASPFTSGNLTSVLVLHAGALGDFVLTYHMLARLRSQCPVPRMDVVARSPLAKWTAGRGVIDGASDYEGFGLEQLFVEPPDADMPMAEKLRAYDLVLSFLGGDESLPASAMRRAGLTALHVDPRPTPETLRSRRHITEQWRDALLDRDWPGRPHPGTELRIHDGERQAANARFTSMLGTDRRPRIIVHPGSGSRTKSCPMEKLECVVAALRDHGCGVLWMVGPTELDWYGPEWVVRLRRFAPVVYEEDVPSAATLVAGADRYLGHDAGMTHVAAAVGVETVVLFGPTDPNVWRPLGPRVTVISGGETFERVDPGQLVGALIRQSLRKITKIRSSVSSPQRKR